LTYSIKHIAEIIRADDKVTGSSVIDYLLIDSRKIVFPETSLFFAISGPRRDGHQFIKEVYERGVRHFVVKKGFDGNDFSEAVFLHVPDVLAALQQLAAWHRKQFAIPVIGITGSNGKTIVKEWLYQLLQKEYHIVRSPRSYNSQIGVPLSVWQMNAEHTLGIFEAGISTVGEMKNLAEMIQPTIGVFTNLADAHSEGFADNRQKATEKALLFKNAASLVFSPDTFRPTIFPVQTPNSKLQTPNSPPDTPQSILLPDTADAGLFQKGTQFFSWSREADATLRITAEEKQQQHTCIRAIYQGKEISVTIPFTDKIAVENAITCWSVLLQMGYAPTVISERMLQLEPVEMRMQLKKAVNNCYLLNDSYSNDLASLDLAVDYLKQQAGKQHTTLILSDMLQSGRQEEYLYRAIAAQVCARGIDRLIGIGTAITKYQSIFTEISSEPGRKPVAVSFYHTTDDFLQQASTHQFKDEYILLKGARVFEFERISNWLEQKVHQTVMEINLSAMVHNLKEYQKHLRPDTKLMAMVKAFSYGSGSAEVARILQFHKVDYLAVAYADEGVELRKAGISLPVMVMNPDEASFDALATFDLEPEIYSFPIYHAFHTYLDQQGIQTFPVHIKFNTGMNRLGFEVSDATALTGLLKQHHTMAVKSVFSHLVASESAVHDGFTEQQISLFEKAGMVMQQELGYSFIRHIANSAAIFRKPEYQFDMVRLGIGLYGVDSAESSAAPLETVITLKSTIAQLRKVKAGDTIGYGRKGLVTKDSMIATVRIGYADGYDRRFGNGVGSMYLNGQLAPVTGHVCMDMAMIDVTDIPGVKEGDTVEIFGKYLPVQQLAKWAGTIPYEIMTGISQRVKRVYMEE